MIYPPTPTALPPGEALIELQNIYSLWEAAPHAIQIWHLGGAMASILQLLILITLVAAGMFVMYKSFEKLIRKDAEN